MDEYVDLSTEQGKERFKKEVRIEKYDKPKVREMLSNAKESLKKEKYKAKAFYEDKVKDKVEGTKSFIKKSISNMKENKRKGLTPFGTRKVQSETIFGRSSGGVMDFQGRNVFDLGSSQNRGVNNSTGRNVFYLGKQEEEKKPSRKRAIKQGKTITIRL